MKFSIGLSLVALALPLWEVAAEGLHGYSHHGYARHQDLAKRAGGGMQLWKRISNSRWTFYDVGLGACGKNNVASDFIVALNSAQFGGGYPGPNCFKMITMTYNGKTTTAQIMDECPGCPYGGLDLSRGLFGFFASLDEGVITGTWSFSGEGQAPPAPPPAPKPVTHKPTPTTTFKVPSITPIKISTPDLDLPFTSHTRTKTSTTSSTSTTEDDSTTTTSHTTNNYYSAGTASGLAIPVPTGSAAPQTPDNLNQINLALVNLGGLMVGGAQAT